MAHWPDRQPCTDLGPNTVRIDRRNNLLPHETTARYLRGLSASTSEGTPVVVTDAQDGWKSSKLWSLEYFRSNYGTEPLIVSDRAPYRQPRDEFRGGAHAERGYPDEPAKRSRVGDHPGAYREAPRYDPGRLPPPRRY